MALKTNTFTGSQFLNLFRLRLLVFCLRIKGVKELGAEKINRERPDIKTRFEFLQEWNALSEVFKALNLTEIEEKEWDDVSAILFATNPIAHISRVKEKGNKKEEYAYFLLSLQDITKFHSGCKIMSANQVEKRVIGVVDDIKKEDFVF